MGHTLFRHAISKHNSIIKMHKIQSKIADRMQIALYQELHVFAVKPGQASLEEAQQYQCEGVAVVPKQEPRDANR